MTRTLINNTILTISIALTLLLGSCKDEVLRPPMVYSTAPALLVIGDTLTITGDHFAPYAFDNLVYINGKVVMDYISATDRQLKVIVPPGSRSGELVVDIRGLKSAPVSVDVFKRDVQIFSVTPNNTLEAPPGSIVEVKGQNFMTDDLINGKASFRFTDQNGERATIIYADSATLQVVVPNGVKTGPVYLWQEGFVYEGPVFSIAKPELLAVSQTQAQEGDMITATGKGIMNVTGFRIDGIETFPESSTAEGGVTFRINAGINPGSHTIEMQFEGEWIATTQVIDIVPLANIVRSVYWVQNNKLMRTSIDGGGTRHTAYVYTGDVQCLAQDPQSGLIYLAGAAGIIAIDATGRPSPRYTQDIGSTYDITISNGMVYWFDGSFRGIRKAPTSGAGPVTGLYPTDNFVNCNGIEVVDNDIYWFDINNRQLMHGRTDGSGTAQSVQFTEGVLNYPMDIDIVRTGGKLMAYVADRPDYNGAPSEVFIYTGELTGAGLDLAPFGSLTSTTGAPYRVSYVNIDAVRGKIVWGNNYDYFNTQLWQSDFDGANAELIWNETTGLPFDLAVVRE